MRRRLFFSTLLAPLVALGKGKPEVSKPIKTISSLPPKLGTSWTFRDYNQYRKNAFTRIRQVVDNFNNVPDSKKEDWISLFELDFNREYTNLVIGQQANNIPSIFDYKTSPTKQADICMRNYCDCWYYTIRDLNLTGNDRLYKLFQSLPFPTEFGVEFS